MGQGGAQPNYTTVAGDTTVAIGDEDAGFAAIASVLNNYVSSQDPDETVKFTVDPDNDSSSLLDQVVDVSDYGERLALRFKPGADGNDATYKTDLNLITEIRFLSASERKRNVFKFVLGGRVDENGQPITGTGLSKGGHSLTGQDPSMSLKL